MQFSVIKNPMSVADQIICAIMGKDSSLFVNFLFLLSPHITLSSPFPIPWDLPVRQGSSSQRASLHSVWFRTMIWEPAVQLILLRSPLSFYYCYSVPKSDYFSLAMTLTRPDKMN